MRAFALAVVLAVVAPCAVAFAEPPQTHQYLTERPSGFWTSNRPAIGGAYRYRLLGVGIMITAVTGFFVARMLRRAGAQRLDR